MTLDVASCMLPWHTVDRETVAAVRGGAGDAEAGIVEKRVAGSEVRVRGTVSSVRYETDERDFQVLIVDVDGEGDCVVVARNAALDVGETAVYGGGWGERKGVRQFEATWVERELPVSVEAIRAYLSKSRFFRGVGPKRADAIVACFGADTLRVLDEEPERLEDVPGLPVEVARTLGSEWGRRASVRAVLLFLQGLGITPALAFRIHQRYEARAVAVVRENPYRLARDVRGIGFATADQIARAMGIAAADLRRIEAGVEHVLYSAGHEGHCRLVREELTLRGSELLAVGASDVETTVDRMAARGEVVYEREPDGRVVVYAREFFDLEDEVARRFAEKSRERPGMEGLDLPELLEIEKLLSFSLADGQRSALLTVIGAPVAVLTGGPGTGKTTLIRAITLHAERSGRLVRLAAPTGRAAKRMSESTGLEASTIHRLLEFDPAAGGFRRDETEPLVADVLIVDESSMLDLRLTVALLRAVGTGTSLLLVGDVDQLPSVGAGDVLRDVIDSGTIPVARLGRVFRQGEHSRIVDAAHAALEGRAIESDRGANGQYFFVTADTPEKIVERVVQVVTERVPDAFGVDPVTGVQVLVPVHGGPVGTRALNEAIAGRLGGTGAWVERGGNRFRVGDKVMQTRNNYQLDCLNGDIGYIVRIDPAAGRVWVDFGGPEPVEYTRDPLEDLVPAWAITVHKSQGSEFRVVVLVLSTHHWIMLQRNLVYTAITRARERLVVVGVPSALGRALSQSDASRRETGLAGRIVRLRTWTAASGEAEVAPAVGDPPPRESRSRS